ncbi:hypothetical protein ATPR_2897 [Acetobacter tropicalis NBRC 101654]|uniref:Uncharacterized protein n=1 Tax=Acetobacter tropicalis NBRC 101654 TaxID=749388 RepID=F7VHP8_9PROT|nr:hypothetical protein ATPR_2897 [Acetobacter tropicalis NBRC 101654]
MHRPLYAKKDLLLNRKLFFAGYILPDATLLLKERKFDTLQKCWKTAF